MREYAITLVSPNGIQVLVDCDGSGRYRILCWHHRLAVEGIDLIDYEPPRPSAALAGRAFVTVEELTQAVDREALTDWYPAHDEWTVLVRPTRWAACMIQAAIHVADGAIAAIAKTPATDNRKGGIRGRSCINEDGLPLHGAPCARSVSLGDGPRVAVETHHGSLPLVAARWWWR